MSSLDTPFFIISHNVRKFARKYQTTYNIFAPDQKRCIFPGSFHPEGVSPAQSAGPFAGGYGQGISGEECFHLQGGGPTGFEEQKDQRKKRSLHLNVKCALKSKHYFFHKLLMNNVSSLHISSLGRFLCVYFQQLKWLLFFLLSLLLNIGCHFLAALTQNSAP